MDSMNAYLGDCSLSKEAVEDLSRELNEELMMSVCLLVLVVWLVLVDALVHQCHVSHACQCSLLC